MKDKVVIVGGGITGMQTAISLQKKGLSPIILEKNDRLGGKVRNWHLLFPSFTSSSEVVDNLQQQLHNLGIQYHTECTVTQVNRNWVKLADGTTISCSAVVVCSGYTLFDARLKEEYGYGIYDNVYTSYDIEKMMSVGKVVMRNGQAPRKIAILHCVGSRDAQVRQKHCSKVCCVTGVKQAIELKKMYPEADVYNFYMDIRMFGPGYEEMYLQAQRDFNVHFLRGRISEASQMMDGRIQLKAEDTLTARPLRMTVDMLILLVGMRSNPDTATFAAASNLACQESGFLQPVDLFLNNVKSLKDGVFLAGAATAPKTIGECISEAYAASEAVMEYLTKKHR